MAGGWQRVRSRLRRRPGYAVLAALLVAAAASGCAAGDDSGTAARSAKAR
ncbi:polysaccharide deacetylase family protein, partial [Streptomyces sp. SID7909]|nr:polysaccharide deacetylase family protein [Streptomyces sp. SID7909]